MPGMTHPVRRMRISALGLSAERPWRSRIRQIGKSRATGQTTHTITTQGTRTAAVKRAVWMGPMCQDPIHARVPECNLRIARCEYSRASPVLETQRPLLKTLDDGIALKTITLTWEPG